jgi:hypothetical protein
MASIKHLSFFFISLSVAKFTERVSNTKEKTGYCFVEYFVEDLSLHLGQQRQMFGIHVTNVFLLHFFVLIQRNEAKKNQGKPDRSARFAL